MHPDSQSPESSSLRSDTGSGPSLRDGAVADFNAFFEKLSALDDLQWSAAPDSARKSAPRKAALLSAAPLGTASRNTAAVAPQGGKASLRARTAAAQAAKSAEAAAQAKTAESSKTQQPRMTVFKSDADLDGCATEITAADVEAVARGRITARDVARFLKLTVVGLLLFALGLGAGWAALSLPGHFNQAMPSLTRLMERARALASAQRSAPEGNDGMASGLASDMAAGTAEPAHDGLRVAQVPGKPRAEAPTGSRRGPAPVPAAQPKIAATPKAAKPQAGAPAAVATAASGEQMGDGIELPVVREPAASTRDGDAAAANPAQAPGEPAFTLQVGACNSFACVENYRRMLLSTVGSRSIRVVTQNSGAGSIQRIRVEPLGRDAGEQLKAQLVELDPRFKDAYLISLR